MPQAADIVLNNGAGTPVAKTFTLVSPAAGLNGLAKWLLKEGAISSIFPQLTALARLTGNQAQLAQIKLRIPSSYTDTVTGLTKVGSAFELNVTATVPFDFPESLKPDAVAFSANLVQNAIIKAMIRDAEPAT